MGDTGLTAERLAELLPRGNAGVAEWNQLRKDQPSAPGLPNLREIKL